MSRLEQLEQLLAENPTDAFTRYGLAMEYSNAGQTEAALQQFAKLLEQNPDYIPGYQMAAQMLLRSGRINEARPILNEGIARAQLAGNAKARDEMRGMLDELG